MNCTACIHAEKPACVDAHHTCLYTICIHTSMQTRGMYAQQISWCSIYYCDNPTSLVSAYNTRWQEIDRVGALAWVYTRIYICIYICRCVYIYVCMCISIHLCIYICICIYIHIYIQIYIHECIYINIYMYSYMYIYVCIYIHLCFARTNSRIFIHTGHVYVLGSSLESCSLIYFWI